LYNKIAAFAPRKEHMNHMNIGAFKRPGPFPPADGGTNRAGKRAMRTSPTLSVHELRRIVAEMVG